MTAKSIEYYSRQRCKKCGMLISDGPEKCRVCPSCGYQGLEAAGEGVWAGSGGGGYVERNPAGEAEDAEALGRARFAAGRMEEAEGYFRQAAEAFQRLGEQQPAAYLPRAAKVFQALGGARLKLGRVREALLDLREAVRIYMQLAGEDTETFTPELVSAMDILGSVCAQTVGGEEAEPVFRSLLDLLEPLAQHDPRRYGEKLADILDKVAGLHLQARRWEEAERHYGRSMELRRELRSGWEPEFEANFARQGLGLAGARMALGKKPAAAEAARESLEIYETLSRTSPGKYDRELAKCRDIIASFGMDEEVRAARRPGFWDRLLGRGRLVECPICGGKNEAGGTFRCPECGSEGLCPEHRDGRTGWCEDCARKAAVRSGGVEVATAAEVLHWVTTYMSTTEGFAYTAVAGESFRKETQRLISWARGGPRPEISECMKHCMEEGRKIVEGKR